MGQTFFTADLHLGHRLVSGLRGYDDPAEHGAVIAERWRSVVGSKDAVWVLGDLAVVTIHGSGRADFERIAVLAPRSAFAPKYGERRRELA